MLAWSDSKIDDPGVRILWPWLDFHMKANARPESGVVYRARGKTVRVAKIGRDLELSKPPPWILRKLFWFRSVSPPEENYCRH